MKLQGSMRARLRALTGRERAPASDEPTRVRRQPVRGARDAEHRRRDLIVHGVALTGAAALVLIVITSLEGDAPVVRRSRFARTEAAVAPQTVASSNAGTLEAQQGASVLGACAGEPSLTFSLDAHRRLDLGSRALLVANHGAVVGAAQSADCDLRVGLADGSLAVHAGDLRGRALVVQTSRGEIRVKGTIFLVDFYAASGELEVGVDEGTVELVLGPGKSVVLEPGQAAYLGSHLELEPFDDSGRARVRRMLGLEAKRARERGPRAHSRSDTRNTEQARAGEQ